LDFKVKELKGYNFIRYLEKEKKFKEGKHFYQLSCKFDRGKTDDGCFSEGLS
jgi:hypothetical protein